MSERTDFSPFNASGASWGSAPATHAHLVGEIRRLRECYCGSGSGGNSGGVSLYFESAAVMRASTEYTSNRLAFLSYAVSPAGGGGGWFRYNLSSGLSDDGIDTFIPTNNTTGIGAWERLT